MNVVEHFHVSGAGSATIAFTNVLSTDVLIVVVLGDAVAPAGWSALFGTGGHILYRMSGASYGGTGTSWTRTGGRQVAATALHVDDCTLINADHQETWPGGTEIVGPDLDEGTHNPPHGLLYVAVAIYQDSAGVVVTPTVEAPLRGLDTGVYAGSESSIRTVGLINPVLPSNEYTSLGFWFVTGGRFAAVNPSSGTGAVGAISLLFKGRGLNPSDGWHVGGPH